RADFGVRQRRDTERNRDVDAVNSPAQEIQDVEQPVGTDFDIRDTGETVAENYRRELVIFVAHGVGEFSGQKKSVARGVRLETIQRAGIEAADEDIVSILRAERRRIEKGDGGRRDRRLPGKFRV